MPMFLSPVAFNRLLAHLGQDVSWYRAYKCPCRSPKSGAATEGCPQCGGLGWTWSAPVAGYLGLTGQKTQKYWKEFGAYEDGDVVVTLPSDSPIYGLGDFDKIRFTEGSTEFKETLVRGSNDVPLSFLPTVVERLYWLDENGAVVEGDLPTPRADQTLSWAPGAIQPDVGTQYSMTGRKYQDYFVAPAGFSQERAHHHGATLPRKAVLRRFDLFGR